MPTEITDILSLSLLLTWVVVSAVIAVFSTKIIHSVFSFAFFCIGLSGIFFYGGFNFYGIIHLIIYLGTTVVFIFFLSMVVPLYSVWNEKKQTGNRLGWVFLPLMIGGSWFYAHLYIIPKIDDFQPIVALSTLFELIFQQYFIPYLLISILMLAGIVVSVSWNKKPNAS